MSLDSDKKLLMQENTLNRLSRKMNLTDMVTVYLRDRQNEYNAIYCALIQFDHVERSLSDPVNWDLRFGESMPADSGTGPAGTGQFTYLRRYCGDGIEPLIIDRKFNESQTNYGQREDYREISEEFRLFHNLCHNRATDATDEYIKIDDEGNEEVVAIVEPNRIRIRLREIRQFLAIKEMYLSIQFWHFEYAENALEAPGMTGHDEKTQRKATGDGDICWRLSYRNYSGNTYHSSSLLAGKRLIEPLPKSQSGFGRFAKEQEKEYVDFIIGVDANGDEISDSCDPAIAKSFDYNLEPSNGLIPVHFRKQVLDKYYNEPSKYSVEDSVLYCPWWFMHIDNHHDDKVVVWLCDLFALPYKEQEHWRLHNIPPEGNVSATCFRRDILAEFTESSQPDHLFKRRYLELQKVSEKFLGWQFLQPLHAADAHHLKSLRIPSTNEQRDFDELVLSLAKILIDSLNQEQLIKLISPKQEGNLNPEEKEHLKQSIGCLEIALNACGIANAADHIFFLRNLQKLRSSGTAHRKGTKYKKIADVFDIESQSLRVVFTGILAKASDCLDFFLFLLRSEQINPKIIEENNVDRGYAILSEMVGFAESDSTDGSINHDEVIYELDSKP
jgi:hypothetical protein